MFASPLDEARARIMRGETDEAVQILTLFLNNDFYHAEALFMLGSALLAKGMNGLGAVITSAAIDARGAKGKAFPEALLNLGAAYKAEHQNETASKIWADALRHEKMPRERAKIMTNIGGLYVNEGQPALAVEWCDKALVEDPKCHHAHAQRGIACLELGRWREGWEGWSHTFASGDRTIRSYGDLPVWDGTPGQHVIAWGDQGIGDEIFYASCLKDLERVCRKVTLDCHPRLPALFARSFPEITVHGTRKDLTELDWLLDCDADAAICVADLPTFFRKQGEWTGAPYLRAHNDIPRTNRKRVGISWTGGSKRTRQDLRSLPIDTLAPILRARDDVEWFSLQYTPDAARDVCEVEERTGIRIAHYPGFVECFDYDRTAAFVNSLDLVITVATTVHHLAGALGVPVWTLVPSRPSWRYRLSGERVPWYGSARMFRQEADGDWSAPVEKIARAIVDF